MKPSVRGSFSSFFTGKTRRSILAAISAESSFPLFNNACRSRSSTNEGDEFAELGPPSSGLSSVLKLMTEKREPSRVCKEQVLSTLFRAVSGKSISCGKSLPPENQGRNLCPEVEGINDSSSSQNSSPSTVEESTLRFFRLVDSCSIFKASSASMDPAHKVLDCWDAKSENVESSKKAVPDRSSHLPLGPSSTQENPAIRIENIGNRTADPAIHLTCMSFGSLEGLARTKGDAVDVIYKVNDDQELQAILEKLNKTVVDGSRWSAHLLPRGPVPDIVTSREEIKNGLGLQVSSHLAQLKWQLSKKKIDVEDLEYLHMAIIHLEHPPDIKNS